jgi:hypothetical protein
MFPFFKISCSIPLLLFLVLSRFCLHRKQERFLDFPGAAEEGLFSNRVFSSRPVLLILSPGRQGDLSGSATADESKEKRH